MKTKKNKIIGALMMTPALLAAIGIIGWWVLNAIKNWKEVSPYVYFFLVLAATVVGIALFFYGYKKWEG